jgi:hypothetical protein
LKYKKNISSSFRLSILLGLSLLVFCPKINAQITFNERFHFGYQNIVLTSIYATDSCYYTAGIAGTLGNAPTGSIFAKLDLDGNPLFQKVLFSPGKTYEFWFDCLITTSDGGFANAGYSINYDDGGKSSIIFAKFNSQGDTVFTTSILTLDTTENTVHAKALLQTADGGYVIMTQMVFAPANWQITLLKLDSAGNELWHNIIGDSWRDDAESLQELPDGSLLIGASRNNTFLQGENYSSATHIIKTFSDGTVDWDWYSPPGVMRGPAYDILLQDDGSYIVAASIGTETVVSGPNLAFWENAIYKLDPNFNMVWEHQFAALNGFVPRTELYENNGTDNFTVVGTLMDTSLNHPDHHGHAWLVNMTNDGDIVWERRHSPPNIIDYLTTDIYGSALAADGGYILCGQSIELDPSQLVQQQGWIVKTDSFGCVVTGCGSVGLLPEPQQLSISVYPNPFGDQLFIEGLPDEQSTLIITDLAGREVYSTSASSMVQVPQMSIGIYVVSVANKRGIYYSHLFSKTR